MIYIDIHNCTLVLYYRSYRCSCFINIWEALLCRNKFSALFQGTMLVIFVRLLLIFFSTYLVAASQCRPAVSSLKNQNYFTKVPGQGKCYILLGIFFSIMAKHLVKCFFLAEKYNFILFRSGKNSYCQKYIIHYAISCYNNSPSKCWKISIS